MTPGSRASMDLEPLVKNRWMMAGRGILALVVLGLPRAASDRALSLAALRDPRALRRRLAVRKRSQPAR